MVAPQKVDDVIGKLIECGLGEKEARAFTHLTRIGTSKVTDLAKAAGLKRAETYQVLERLQARGLVEGTLTRPRQFFTLPPEQALASLIEERASELKAVEAHRSDLEERLRKLAGPTAGPAATESFRILHDRNQINGQLSRTVRAAQKELCVVASARSLFRLLLDEGLEKDLKQAASRKVKVRILTEMLAGQEDVLGRLAAFADVRHMMVPRPLRFFVADEREIVQYVTADPMGQGAKETALWIGARDHVQAQRAFFDDAWATAMDAPARLQELASGRASDQLQLVKGRFTRYEKQKEMLLRATKDVRATLDAQEIARLPTSGLGRALASRIREGAKVRLLVPPGAKPDLKGADIRHDPDPDGLPLTLVDGAEALLVLPGIGANDEVTALREYGLWLTLGASVDALSKGFEKRWKTARP